MNEYAKTRSTRLKYTFRVSGNPLNRIVLRFAIPKNIPFQQDVLGIQYEHEPEIIFKENGNRFAQLHLKKVNNSASSTITMDMDLYKNDLDEMGSLQRLNFEIDQEELNRYLISEKFIQSYKSSLVRKAATLTGATKLETLRNIYDFIAHHMSFELQNKTFGALHGFNKKIGDCSEYSSLFIALCRLNKIPAKWVVGQVIKKSKEVATHAWLEVWFDEKGWVRMDPTRRDFSNLQNYYVKLIDTDYQPKIINNATTYQWNYWGKSCVVKLEKSAEWLEDSEMMT